MILMLYYMAFIALGYFVHDEFTTGEFWTISMIFSVGFMIYLELGKIRKAIEVCNIKIKEE